MRSLFRSRTLLGRTGRNLLARLSKTKNTTANALHDVQTARVVRGLTLDISANALVESLVLVRSSLKLQKSQTNQSRHSNATIEWVEHRFHSSLDRIRRILILSRPLSKSLRIRISRSRLVNRNIRATLSKLIHLNYTFQQTLRNYDNL